MRRTPALLPPSCSPSSSRARPRCRSGRTQSASPLPRHRPPRRPGTPRPRAQPSASRGSNYVAERLRCLLLLPQPQEGRRRSRSATGCCDHPEHLGRAAYPRGHWPAAGQRHDPDRHLVLRGLGRRPGPGRGAQPWRERAGGGRQGRQQGPAALALPPQDASAAGSTGPGTRAPGRLISFARQCRGACRGPGGTAHAKYFLFDKVGRAGTRYIIFNTSMNLTRFGLPRPVEPGPGDEVRPASTTTSCASSGRRGSGGRSRSPYHVAHVRQRRRLLLPAPRAPAGPGPGDADPRSG